MPYLDVAKIVSSRAGVTLTPVSVPDAAIGRGNDSEDSGLNAFNAGNGLQFRNDSRRVAFIFENASESVAHVKITTSATVDGLAVADRTVSCPVNGRVVIGPFPSSYNSVNNEDSDGDNPSHSDYIQLEFAVDNSTGEEASVVDDLKITPLVIPSVS